MLNYEVDFYDEALNESIKQYELERDTPLKVIILGFSKEGSD